MSSHKIPRKRSGRKPIMRHKVDPMKYEDYQEKTLGEMLQDSVIVQLMLMFFQIGRLVFKVLCTLIQDIIDGIFCTFSRIFAEDFILMMNYVMPFMYYVRGG